MVVQALGNAIRAWETDVFRLRTISSVSSVPIRADITLLYDDGSDGTIPIFQLAPSSTRTETITTSVPVPRDGWVTNVLARSTAKGIDRGQLYARMQQASSSGQERGLLASGYIHDSRNLTLGDYEDSVSGQGDTAAESIGTDIAGNVDTTHALALTNGVRRIDGMIWYYHCSADVAARTMSFRLLAPYGQVPTGFDAGSDRQILAFPGPALSANEDGITYMGAQGMYTVVVDNNVVTTSDNTTAPNPFPFWVHENDAQSQMNFDITSGEALDTYQAFVAGESWFI